MNKDENLDKKLASNKINNLIGKNCFIITISLNTNLYKINYLYLSISIGNF